LQLAITLHFKTLGENAENFSREFQQTLKIKQQETLSFSLFRQTFCLELVRQRDQLCKIVTFIANLNNLNVLYSNADSN